MSSATRGPRGHAGWVLGLVWCACDTTSLDVSASRAVATSLEPAGTEARYGEIAAPLQDGHEAPQRLELEEAERLALGAFVVDGVVRCTTALVEVGRDARFAITARHCFEREPDLSVFRFVPMDALGRAEGIALAEVWPHPDVDAALVVLAAPVEGARPFTIAEDDAAAWVDTELEVAGAGLGSGGGMRFGLFEVVDVSPTRIEVRSDTSGQCAGDSGGPWFSVERPGEIVAVASTSAPSCGNPAFGVRLDRLVGWVAAHTQRVEYTWAPAELTPVGTPGCASGGAWFWAFLVLGIRACHRCVRSA